MKVEILERTGYFEGKLYGDASVGGFVTFFELLLSHKNWKQGTAFLGDITGLDSNDLTMGDVQEIANLTATHRDQLGNSRYAVLVSRDLEYGMVRVWMAFTESATDMTTGVFRSKKEALSWLKGQSYTT
jgi:hypothetical protein